MSRRVDRGTRDVAQLGRELWIAGQLKLPQVVRLQAVVTPDALHRIDADFACRVRCRVNPLRCLARWFNSRHHYDTLGYLCRPWLNTRQPNLVAQQSVHTNLYVTLLPTLHRGFAHVCPPLNLIGNNFVACQQHDPGMPEVLLRTVAVLHNRFQPVLVRSAHLDDDTCAHGVDSHVSLRSGAQNGTFPSELIH